MFHCRLCQFQSTSLKLHLDHHKFHRNITPYYYCGYEKCKNIFKVQNYLMKHLLRTHGLSSKEKSSFIPSTVRETGKFVCNAQFCKKQFDSHSELIKHLKAHITRGHEISCPYHHCNKKWKVLSSFTSHMSKIHRGPCNPNSDVIENDEIIPKNSDHSVSEASNEAYKLNELNILHGESIDGNKMEVGNHLSKSPHVDYESPNLFLENLAQFYLRLESQYLIPIATIQYIVTEGYKIHEESQTSFKERLTQHLLRENVTPEKINDIFEEVFNHDPFTESHTVLGTNYKRKKFYTEQFDYIKPRFITINEIKKTFFAYVPIAETLKSIFTDKSINDDFHIPGKFRENGLLKDFSDGMIYKNNEFLKKHPDALQIILFQDAFEIVNPLGAAKKKYKLLGVYMTLGNLPDYLRTHINSIKLVALCRETDLDHQKVYGKIVEDLKIIEQQGIEFSGKNIKGIVTFICGDNLGSHNLGGFTENFSTSKYFCRFCLIDRESFESANGACQVFRSRNAELYDEAINKRDVNNDTLGIKFNSIFNQLENFHVCTPGLPPCLGHDLFEGVIAYDLKLCIDYFIRKKWFTLEQLNNRIEKFPYSTLDKCDKPSKIPASGRRIVGGACQVWTFLRIFPLLIEDKINNADDEVWESILLLTEIVEIVTAPVIHKSHLPYLDAIIHYYIILRQKLFPNNKLRPKHHYICHYAQLTSEFGPLIKVWTMRFESKHRFFKRSIRNLHNFINVIKSLSEKHELLQTLIRLGSDVRLQTEIHELQDFQIHYYHPNIQTVVKKANLPQGIQECSKVTLKGTMYKKGDVLLIRQSGYQYRIVIGSICLLLCFDHDIYGIFEIFENEFIPYLRAYKVGQVLTYECHSLCNIMDFKPSHKYNIGNMICVKPQYGFVTHPL